MVLARHRFTSGNRLVRDRVILRRIAAGSDPRLGPDRLRPGQAPVRGHRGRRAIESLPQRRSSRNGKFLRLSPRSYRGRGGRAQIYSIGHRNPQGFDWQPGTRRLVATEHGPETNDEVNVIRRGANYGWPRVNGRNHGRFRAPIAVYDPSVAPSGATFVTTPGSAWTGDYLFATLVGESIRRLEISRAGQGHGPGGALPGPLRSAAHRGRGARRCALRAHEQPRRTWFTDRRGRPHPALLAAALSRGQCAAPGSRPRSTWVSDHADTSAHTNSSSKNPQLLLVVGQACEDHRAHEVQPQIAERGLVEPPELRPGKGRENQQRAHDLHHLVHAGELRRAIFYP